MANNRKKRNANRKPEQAKTQGSLNDEVKEELKEEFKEDVKEDFEEETWEDSVEEAEQAMKRTELEKQSRENRQNLLLVLGVVAFLAIVGIVIFLTSGSSDEEQVAATGTTGEIAAADSTGDMDVAVVENIEEEGTEDAVEAATEAEVSGDEVQEIVEEIRVFLICICFRFICRVKSRCAHHADDLTGLPVIYSDRACPSGQGFICRAVRVRIYGKSYPLAVRRCVICTVQYVISYELAPEDGYGSIGYVALGIAHRMHGSYPGLVISGVHETVRSAPEQFLSVAVRDSSAIYSTVRIYL